MFIELLKTLLVVFLLLVVAIIIVRFSKTDRTFDEAIKICVGFIKKLFHEISNKDPVMIVYPVFIGMDNLGYFSLEAIDKAFSSMHKYFETCYSIGVNNSFENRIIYGFKIQNPNPDYSTENMLTILHGTSQEILHKHLCGLNYPHDSLDRFIAISMNDAYCYVHIAKNDNGLSEIDMIKINQRNVSLKKTAKPVEVLSEDWESNE